MEPGSATDQTVPRWRGKGLVVLAGAVVVHVVFGMARIPHAVVVQRFADVEGYRRQGDVAWLFRTAKLEGADAITAVRALTGPDAVIAIRDDLKGAMEWAPPLLWPRLCCAVERLPAGARTFAGRPIADLVLVGEGHYDARGERTTTTLRVESR